MSINGKAYIVGAFEHPTRKADDKSVAQLHAEVAYGALQDAGLSKDDVDGFFCTGAAPGLGPLNMADYLGLTIETVSRMITQLQGAGIVEFPTYRQFRICNRQMLEGMAAG